MHQNSLYEKYWKKNFFDKIFIVFGSFPQVTTIPTLSCYFLIAKSSLHSRKTSTFCKCTKVTGTSQKSCYPLTEYLHQSSHHEMYWWHMPLQGLLVWLYHIYMYTVYLLLLWFFTASKYYLFKKDTFDNVIFTNNNSKISLYYLWIHTHANPS